MDFGKAFSFVFEDDGWITKLLLGGVILLIPVIGWFVVWGWMLEIGRRAASDTKVTLPDWNDFGVYLTRGAKAFVVGFVYALPFIILYFLEILISPHPGPRHAGGSAALGLIQLSLSCINLLYSIFLAFVLPAALMRFTMEDDNIAAGLAFGEVFNMVLSNLGTYFLVFLGSLIAGIIADLGLIACVVGVIFTFPYATAIMGHFYGQSYAVASGGSPQQPAATPPTTADWSA